MTPNDGAEDGSTGSASVTIDSDWAGALTFTNCGQSGRTGPSQNQCDSTYSGSLLSGQVTVTAGYQYWTVPSNGVYVITAHGAQGGGSQGGYGASMNGEFTLSAGEVLTILVGQEGVSHNGSSSGGGGGTYVVDGQNVPMIIAGGGAGGINGYAGDSGQSGEDSSQSRNYGLGWVVAFTDKIASALNMAQVVLVSLEMVSRVV